MTDFPITKRHFLAPFRTSWFTQLLSRSFSSPGHPHTHLKPSVYTLVITLLSGHQPKSGHHDWKGGFEMDVFNVLLIIILFLIICAGLLYMQKSSFLLANVFCSHW